VLGDAYIKGIHIDRDIKLVQAGFHPEFAMSVMHNKSDHQSSFGYVAATT